VNTELSKRAVCILTPKIICDDGTIEIVKVLLSDIMKKDCKA